MSPPFNKFLDDSNPKNRERLAFFTESNPRPVVEVNLKGKIIYTNPSAEAVFSSLEAINNEYLSGLKKIIKFLLKNKPEYFSRDVKIGKKRWFRQFFYYVPHFNSIIVYGADITDQKNAEESIKIAEERYHMLFEKMDYGYALQDIIFDKDKKPADYRFIDVNKAFERLSGIKKRVIIGKTANEIRENTPQTKENIENRKKYDNTALTGAPLHIETYNERLNKYLEIYAYKPNNKQIALLLSDITSQKKSEEDKDNFISILSHELRNPLTPILANAQFINFTLEKEKKLNFNMAKELVSAIEDQAKIMAGLLNDILDVAKLNLKKIALNKKKIDISEPIKKSVKACMPLITIKNQKISVFFDQNQIYVSADPLRIEQVMINLISNASKYTDEKGEIEVHCYSKENSVQITVKDNGTGMDKKKQSKIFELFNTEGQSFMGAGGLGIGLNIVKHLTLMHGGNISVKSEGKNKGSEFIITLPIAKRKDAYIKSVEQKITTEKKIEKILIVEDDKNIRDIFSKILHQKGYKVMESNKGIPAVKISKSFKPDAALIDIGLPDISGYKVAKMMSDNKDNKKIKLIAVTGYGQQKDKILAKKAGFHAHLTKPVDINNLIKLLS